MGKPSIRMYCREQQLRMVAKAMNTTLNLEKGYNARDLSLESIRISALIDIHNRGV